MENKRTPAQLIATDSPRPGDFPIGSEMSRAAARAMLESRATTDDSGFTLIVRSVLLSAEDTSTCMEILRSFLPRTGMRVVDLCSIPQGMTGPALESWVRQHGAELCGARQEAAYDSPAPAEEPQQFREPSKLPPAAPRVSESETPKVPVKKPPTWQEERRNAVEEEMLRRQNITRGPMF